jgi:DhnA family fructose-bisphosphate aldolase class Ia
MPFIAEAEYPTTYASVDDLGARFGVEYLRRNARLCVELGADLVKVNWTGDESSFAEIVGLTGVPVVVAGGSLVSDEELLQRMEQARRAGAVGASIGRNIFEHDNPERITRAVSMIFREGASAEDALSLLERPLAEVATS